MPAILLLFVTFLSGLFLTTMVGIAGFGAKATASQDLEQLVGAPQDSQQMADQAIEPYRKKLLTDSLRAIKQMPLNPHIKSRSRLQEQAVRVCLELKQPNLALQGIEDIQNWRQGVSYAELALYCIQNNHLNEAHGFLEKSAAIANNPGDRVEQGWRRDRIQNRLAQAYHLLGDAEEAAKWGYQHTEVKIEEGKRAAANTMSDELFSKSLNAVDGVLQAGNFDLVRAALEDCVVLQDLCYKNPERRVRCEEKIQSSWKGLPIDLRVALTLSLGEQAAAHQDSPHALEMSQRAEEILNHYPLTLEVSLPLQSQRALLHYQAGDKQGAMRLAEIQSEIFANERNGVADIFRAETLRPLAEAYQQMGADKKALKVYQGVVTESVLNPNARPRLEDLVETCLSLALLGVPSDPQLSHQIQEAFDGLVAPW